MRDENIYKQTLKQEMNFRDTWHNIWCMIVVKQEFKDTNIYILKDNNNYTETDSWLNVQKLIQKIYIRVNLIKTGRLSPQNQEEILEIIFLHGEIFKHILGWVFLHRERIFWWWLNIICI